MKKWFSFTVVMVLLMSVVLAGCGGGSGQGGDTNKDGDAKTDTFKNIKVGMVTDTGGVNDNSFNQSAWEGLKQLEKDTNKKAAIKYLESTKDADYVPNLNEFVNNGYDITWGIGLLLEEPVKTVASQNPDSYLGIIDAVVEAPNVASVLFSEQEGSFLVGVVAGMMTETGKIGFVGGMEIPVIQRFHAGFEAGIKAVNPDAELLVNYTGEFSKPDLGKAAAATFYDQGADIVFHAAGGTGDGVFNEARDRFKAGQKVWVIGVDKDQSLAFGDDITLTSMIKRVDQAVYQVSMDLAEGKAFESKVTVLGLKENGVGIAETSSKNVPQDVLDKVEEYRNKIINGEIIVPEMP